MGNQLIIIGNGFDLECGLKSSYGDFFKHLANRSPTTRNDEDNIWNHIFKFLHDTNSLVHFFRSAQYMPESFDDWKQENPYDWDEKEFGKWIQKNFDERERENLDVQGFESFDDWKQEIFDDWKREIFNDWRQEDPNKWKDVESVIRDWVIGILTAPNREFGTADAPKDVQWIIGRLLVDDEFHSLVDPVLDNPDKTSTFPKPSALDKRLHDLLQRYSKPLRELLDWVRNFSYVVSRTDVADVLFSALETFELEFMDYMRIELLHSLGYRERASELYALISSTNGSFPVNDYVLSFNYTRPDIVTIRQEIRCWRNVHGGLESKNAIFGFDITDLQHEQRKKHDFIRFTKTYRVLQLPQKSIGQPKVLEPVTDGESFDAIRVYGHSLDRADYSYFKAIFDCVDLYSSNVKLFFFYPANRPETGSRLYQSVSDLLTDYGDEMPDEGKGRNLMHKLLLQDRLSVIPLDTTLIDDWSF